MVGAVIDSRAKYLQNVLRDFLPEGLKTNMFSYCEAYDHVYLPDEYLQEFYPKL